MNPMMFMAMYLASGIVAICVAWVILVCRIVYILMKKGKNYCMDDSNHEEIRSRVNWITGGRKATLRDWLITIVMWPIKVPEFVDIYLAMEKEIFRD